MTERAGALRQAALTGLVLSLLGCATAADIKPGVIRGLDRDTGYVKTSEGVAVAARGCPDADLWRAALAAVHEARPGRASVGERLTVLEADEARGRITAVDRYLEGFPGGTYVGVFIHRLGAEDRLVEVSAFWRSRMGATANPWERILLHEIARRLPCVIPGEQVILRKGS